MSERIRPPTSSAHRLVSTDAIAAAWVSLENSMINIKANKINRLLAVKRTTTGLGLFSTEEIPAKRRIIEYVGPLISNAEVETRHGKYFFGVNSKWSIDGSARTNTARYFNHSCKPNAEAFVTGRRVWIWSKRRIKAGEEITINYGKEYFDDQIKPIGCKCKVCLERSERKRAGQAGAD